ncbi:MAG: metallophosphoesterase [Promethearchaeota archaeon]
MSTFRILVLADIHGNVKAVTKIISIIHKRNLRIDLIVIAGDLPETTPIRLMLQYILTHGNLSKTKYTRWVYKEQGRQKFVQIQIKSIKTILSLLSSLDVPIIYVPGNVDSYEVQQILSTWPSSELIFLAAEITQIGPLRILGFGGSLFSPDRYKQPLCDMEFYSHDFSTRLKPLYRLSKTTESNTIDVLISHEPPAFHYNTTIGDITGGSSSISKFINHIKPKIVIFGHYHELPLIKKANNIIYINPGPLTCYHFALLDIEKKHIHVSLKKMNPVRFDYKNMIYSYRSINIRNLAFE